eukprot:gene21553-33161_t
MKLAETDNNINKKRECLKKVIAYMTLGIDTSPLFMEVIMASVTKDVVQKKMKGFSDTSPYVRKTAVVASCKLWRMSPKDFEDLVDKLQTLIRDSDSHVSCNALVVLNEALAADGGVQVTKQIVYPLLNKLQDLNEWQQCMVLELVLRYVPAGEDEMFKIMNLLEKRLYGSNSAVILAATHVFLNLTQNLPSLHLQVYSRLKEPLLTLAATAPMETAYVCLCHIKLLISREPEVFAENYKDFYCRYNDPSFVKSLKLEILVLIANTKNFKEILTELAAYVTDVQVDTVRRAIRAMGEISLKTNA